MVCYHSGKNNIVDGGDVLYQFSSYCNITKNEWKKEYLKCIDCVVSMV